MLAPYKGRIYDPCCGSGGMFVQSEKFVESHGGKLGDISIYGQESNATTRRLAVMNGGKPGEYEPHVSMFGDGFPFEKCCINEHVYRLRANQRLSQEYLYFWMTSELVFAEMRIKGTGVAIPGLNATAVRSLAVLVPPLPIVQAFTKQAAILVTRLLVNAKQSRTLATLRDTLLPKLLSLGSYVWDSLKPGLQYETDRISEHHVDREYPLGPSAWHSVVRGSRESRPFLSRAPGGAGYPGCQAGTGGPGIARVRERLFPRSQPDDVEKTGGGAPAVRAESIYTDS